MSDGESIQVNHPTHYNMGAIEVIDAIEAWGLGFSPGNAVKYIARGAHKGTPIADAQKALWYISRHLANLRAAEPPGKWTACSPGDGDCS